MNKVRLFLMCLIFSICISCLGQKIEKYDQVINMKYYKAYYNKNIQTSSFVIYKLYKGGGDVSRTNMSFKAYKNLPHFNYTNSGYDRGHLVPAEDFANNKTKLKSTFYYINCVPQTVKLNRGIWKKYEGEIRKFSQRDSLLVICGGCDYDNRNILIPRNCFKLVYNLKTKKCIYSLMFKNDNSGYVWVEAKDSNILGLKLISFRTVYEQYEEPIAIDKLNWDLYGKTWRLWSAMPTKIDRKEAKWND